MAARSTTSTDKNVVDVSSFFLFEATGDSESCSVSDPDISGDRDGRSVSLDEDDAESCSWDSADQCPSNGDSMNGRDAIDREGDDDNKCDRDEEEEPSDSVQIQTWSNGGGERRKSNVSEDSTTEEFESLNEMEKNRLFWETCLAS